jgi:hypothetical protein
MSRLKALGNLNSNGRGFEYWERVFFLLALLFLVNGRCSFGQISNPTTPIIFQNGNNIPIASLAPTTTESVYPVLLQNPVEVLGTGGTLSLVSGYYNGFTFAGPFSGSGVLTMNLQSNGYLLIQDNSIFPNGFNLESGVLYISGPNLHDATVAGPLAVSGTVYAYGATTFASSSVSGASGTQLNFDGVSGGSTSTVFTFSGGGPNFDLESTIDLNPQAGPEHSIIVLNNTSGTQTFGGPIGDAILRVGPGGTTIIKNQLGDGLNCMAGTVVLSGALGRGAVGGEIERGIYLQGGTLVLDNSTANNDDRMPSQYLTLSGGTLSLIGVNGGATNQYTNLPRGTNQTTGPVFGKGFTVMQVQAGTGAGSSAALTWGGLPTSYDGSVDFEGLETNAQVFFNTMTEGPIAPWATYGGTDFASYDTTNGVVPLAPTGRPSQVSAGTTGSYVLGTGTQTALSSNVSLYGVTMNAGTSLDLGGNTLTLGAWIQNTSPASISDGELMDASIFENDHYFGDIVFTTNSDLSVSTSIVAGSVLKNGPGTLTLTGSALGTQGISTGFPILYVNQGTLALNLTAPLQANSQQFVGNATIVVGGSTSSPGSAILSLLGSNQFITSSSNGNALMGMQIWQSGQFNMNGYNATLLNLENDGGTVDTGGGTLTVGSIQCYQQGFSAYISSGTVNLSGTSPTISVAGRFPYFPYAPAYDGLVISSQLTSSVPLSKTGAGVLTLTNATNSFGNGTVGMVVSAGTVSLQNSGAAGSTNQQIQLTSGN